MKTYDHAALQNEWATSERWRGIKRDYTAEDVAKLRGSVEIKYTLAERGAIIAFRPLILHASSPATAPAHRRVIHIDFAAVELPEPLEWHSRVA